jgi:hypothetical protein
MSRESAADRDVDPTGCTPTKPTITGAAGMPAYVVISSPASPGAASIPATNSAATDG